MIGGYLYSKLDEGVERCLYDKLGKGFSRIKVWENGCLFYDNPFQDNLTQYLSSDELIVLSQDLLVTEDPDVEYRELDLQKDFPEMFRKKGPVAFNSIASDIRMAIVDKINGLKMVFLVSNRAGSGRIFFNRLAYGILFCSDLRFLLKIVPLDVNNMGIYSILKYGAVPEPMTISNNISAVPAAHYIRYDLNNNGYSISPYFKFRFALGNDQDPREAGHAILEPVKGVLRNSARFLSKYEPAILMSGGIDSSLYAFYLNETGKNRLKAFYCAFDKDDPEYKFAKAIAEKTNADFQVGNMKKEEAIGILEDVVRLTDHPFADFSSLPIVFMMKYIKEHLIGRAMIIDCNGGDDCFGFSALDLQSKYLIKHRFPNFLKRLIVGLLKNSPS